MVRIKRIYIGDKLGYGNETQFRASLGLEPKKPVSDAKNVIKNYDNQVPSKTYQASK